MERVASSESLVDIAEYVGAAANTLRELYNDPPELYFRGEADDDCVNTALKNVRPLNNPVAEPSEELNERLKRLKQEVENLE